MAASVQRHLRPLTPSPAKYPAPAPAGQHSGRVERCPATGGMLLHVEWGAPLAGTGTDHFNRVSAGGQGARGKGRGLVVLAEVCGVRATAKLPAAADTHPAPCLCLPADVLHVDTTMVVGGREVRYRQVYRRKG